MIRKSMEEEDEIRSKIIDVYREYEFSVLESIDHMMSVALSSFVAVLIKGYNKEDGLLEFDNFLDLTNKALIHYRNVLSDTLDQNE